MGRVATARLPRRGHGTRHVQHRRKRRALQRHPQGVHPRLRAAPVQHLLQRRQGDEADRRGVRTPRRADRDPDEHHAVRHAPQGRAHAHAVRGASAGRLPAVLHRGRQRPDIPSGRTLRGREEGRPAVDGREGRRDERDHPAQRPPQRLRVREPDEQVPRARALQRRRRVVLPDPLRRQVPPEPVGPHRAREHDRRRARGERRPAEGCRRPQRNRDLPVHARAATSSCSRSSSSGRGATSS